MPFIKAIFAILTLIVSTNLHARQVADVSLDEQIELAGQTLTLNGAGIRSKFIFDIYVGALYLPKKSNQARQVLAMGGPKRVLMHFLYDEVDKERLTGGWTAGFENNLSEQEFNRLKPRLADFNKLFRSVKKDDVVFLDDIPNKGTAVLINNTLMGYVQGEDFYRALLQVWLGDDPADEDLKSNMLGVSPD